MLDELGKKFLAALEKFHARSPETPGMPAAELSAGIDAPLAGRGLARLVKEGKIIREGETVRLASHDVGFRGEDAARSEKILADLSAARFAPPTVRELVERYGRKKGDVEKTLDALVKQGKIVRVHPTLYYDAARFAELRALVETHLAAHGDIDA
ncbi:MAG: hypothetical protein M5R36_07850 [Deltaproteobacteria bacterium]|nr:hypothetical protein [Deltaproteobacteria bacterium]